MGFSEFKSWLSSKSSSTSPTTAQHPVGTRSPFGPGSSKVDYAYNTNKPSSPTAPGHAQSYYDGSYDLPPPYCPESASGFNEPPAAIAIPTPSLGYAGKIHNQTELVGESPLKILENHDIAIVLDDSYSMLIADSKSGRTRWDQAWSALATLVRVGSRYDRDGIEVHFLNRREADRTVRNEEDLQRLRSEVHTPRRDACTPIGDALDALLLDYERKTGDSPGRYGVKKKIFLVITDGAATDAPEDAIIRAANFFHHGRFPLDQVGIQFIQVGNDPGATMFLEELDEELAGVNNTRDIVDTIKSTGDDLKGDALIKALTGGFNRRQDRAGERRQRR